jgi:hypothetical protein
VLRPAAVRDEDELVDLGEERLQRGGRILVARGPDDQCIYIVQSSSR